MPRQLPFGIINKLPVPDTIRKNGTTGSFGNNGFPGNYMDQLLFEVHQDHVLGSSSQLALNACTMRWNGTNYVDKSAAIVSFSNYDRISIVGSDILTANMVLPSIAGLKMRSINGAELRLGIASGRGEPYRIIHDPATIDADIDIKTDKLFEELSLIYTVDERQYYANQSYNSKIVINGVEIYTPTMSGSIVSLDSIPMDNPYLIRMDGQQLHYKLHATPSTNNTLTWFRDLNRKLGGLRDGAEVQSRFTMAAINDALFQVNTAYGVLRELNADDTDLHTRSDRNGVSVVTTADFIGSAITFSAIDGIKNGMRISGAGIPMSPIATTIITNIIGLTAVMVDAETLVQISASGTGVTVTMDNSGASGGSEQSDGIANHGHYLRVKGDGASVVISSGGGYVGANGIEMGRIGTPTTPLNLNTAISDVLTPASTTRDRSIGVMTYQRA